MGGGEGDAVTMEALGGWVSSVLRFDGLLVFLMVSPSQVSRTTVGRGT